MLKAFKFVFILLVLTTSLHSNNKNAGIGVILGEPTGIVAKYWLNEFVALDAAAGWSLDTPSHLHLHADYLYQKYYLVEKKEDGLDLPVYFGIGGKLLFQKNINISISIRFPMGIDYLFTDVSIDVFFEVVPCLDLLPATSLDLNVGLGSRFFF